MSDHAHPEINYVKIYVILLVLLAISVVGPMLEIKWLTLMTAFGIAVVKALMVAGYFMHLKFEKRYIWYMLLLMIFCLVLLFIGLAPDVMKAEGQNWVNPTPEGLGSATGAHDH